MLSVGVVGSEEHVSFARDNRSGVAMSQSYAQLEQAARVADPFPETRETAEPSLLALSPNRGHSDFKKLRHAVSRHRVIILRRGAVIAVTTLVSIGGALFLHALFAGAIIWSALFPFALHRGDGKTFIGEPDSGGAPAAFSVGEQDSPSDAGAPIGTPAAAALATPAQSTIETPSLNALPDRTPAVALPLLPAPSVTAAPTEELGTIKVKPPAAVASLLAQQVVSSANAAPGTAERAGKPAGSDVAFGGFTDEPVSSLGRGRGGSGTGRGVGNGLGNGIDRGISAANRSPQLLNSADASQSLVVPLKYQLKPPEKDVQLVLEIHADGSIGDIKLVQSCGIRELDDLVIRYAQLSFRFSPGYQNGKAVDATFEYSQSFRPFDE